MFIVSNFYVQESMIKKNKYTVYQAYSIIILVSCQWALTQIGKT